MIKIAHLSDIHFGNNFSEATWNAVASVVVGFVPDLIVVSGDLVENPSPAHLLAARCALFDLTERARAKSKELGGNGAVELVVIPGNHDVFESGVAVGLKPLPWFRRIFDAADTSKAEDALKLKLVLKPNVESLGFNGRSLGFPAGTRPQDVGKIAKAKAWVAALWSGRTTAPSDDPDDFVNYLVAGKPLADVRNAASAPVLLALLDSNPSMPGPGDTATGIVDNDQLISLQEKLAQVKGLYVARIAVVHHHVLPIAFASGVAGLTGESMMVLRNAGAVLRILADHRFDLILHGHWHKPQFARIDFGTSQNDSYPIAVAAAGSAAMTSTDNPRENSINLITIADSGRIGVKSLYYGAGQDPDPDNKSGHHFHEYSEPLSAVKRRAYFRALERHDIECKEREQICEITENGDLWVTQRVAGLRVRRARAPYKQRPLGIAIPTHGHFLRNTFAPDGESERAGVTLSAAPNHPGSKAGELEYHYINLPGRGLVKGGEPSSYGVDYGCANCMKMTAWEARERSRSRDEGKSNPTSPLPPGFDNEWLAARVSYPTGKLVLKAKFPQSLAMVQPYVECRRQPEYPIYKVDAWGDVDRNPSDMEIDGETQAEEQRELRYDATERTWVLEIDRPMVGYQYALRWQVPNDEAIQETAGSIQEWHRVLLDFHKTVDATVVDTIDDAAMERFKRLRAELNQEIADNTLQSQRDLLSLGKRIDEMRTDPQDQEAIKQFDLLYKALEREAYQGRSDERWFAALFIYDTDKMALRPVLSRRSWTEEILPRNFQVSYGDGVAGAAFQQRRIISWNQRSADRRPVRPEALITPMPLPDPNADPAEMVNILAVPVYHSGMENLRRPPPWAGIGVVTIGSSSYASPIGRTEDGRGRVRLAAQIQLAYIIGALRRPPEAASEA